MNYCSSFSLRRLPNKNNDPSAAIKPPNNVGFVVEPVSGNSPTLAVAGLSSDPVTLTVSPSLSATC